MIGVGKVIHEKISIVETNMLSINTTKYEHCNFKKINIIIVY